MAARINLNVIISTVIPAALFLARAAGAAPLFETTETLAVELDAPLSTLLRERSEDDDLDGEIRLTSSGGEAVAVPVELRARGNFRRKPGTCPFPPIRLDFDGDNATGTVFEGQDKLKLVTHCNTSRSKYEQLLLREYLAYRILGVLTERSFRVRLLRVTYRDTEEDAEPFERWGFVIEDEDALAARIGLERLKVSKLGYNDVDPGFTSLITLFEYMIGNTDFSLIRGPAGKTCCHNAVPYSDGHAIWPIPYDFDFSGIVNAPYATPDPRFKIRSVTRRVYRGRCTLNGYLPDAIRQFREKRHEINTLPVELKGLEPRTRREVTEYLHGFYEIIADEKSVDRRLVRECS